MAAAGKLSGHTFSPVKPPRVVNAAAGEAANGPAEPSKAARALLS